ncbi:MAG: hypothetical protein HC941_07760 [Microcoleus sp. SU_5_3]|nr:hypothetical protein [Microcoleus sp. SU_5_3]
MTEELEFDRLMSSFSAKRKPNIKLIIALLDDRQRSTDQFFFEASSEILLTTAD